MSRLSLTDWYRYLETQYADDEPEPQPSEPVAETPAYDSPAASPSSSEPLSPAAPKEQTPTVAAAQTPAAPAPAESRRDALVSIRVPDFAEFVPLIEQEVGRKPSAAPAPRAEPAPTPAPTEPAPASSEPPSDGPRLRKRKGRNKRAPETVVPPEADKLWAKLPQYLRYLAEWTDDDGVTRKYYPVRGRDESREELIARLTDPVLTLEETARLLGVCPATVRRYTDRGWLRCFRTDGNQRRFRLSDIVAFLEEQALRQPRGNRNAHRESETP
jgi:excisionase family DNA binding protein